MAAPPSPANPLMKKLEIADFVIRLLTLASLIAGGLWVYYQYEIGGATAWQTNLTLETQTLPYHDDLRLLVVHVKSKNPRSVEFDLVKKEGDSFTLRVRKIACDAKGNTVIDPDKGDVLVPDIDLLAKTGGEYDFAPNAEMDDMRIVVVPAGTVVALTADMEMNNGTLDEHGKPDTDFISASTVVHIER
ncbi:hypothetical protein R75461_07266 [Paraburkholderia nemoris]|nr:hypothetical protein R75461_07266 [Paraburkholderia nemoris]